MAELQITHLLQQLQDPIHHQIAETNLSQLVLSNPPQALTSLVKVGATSTDASVRISSFVLFKRLAFRNVNPQDQAQDGATSQWQIGKQLWDSVAEADRAVIQTTLLQSLIAAATKPAHERNIICDAIASVYTASIARAAPWSELTAFLSQLFASTELTLRESSFRIYSDIPELLEHAPAQDTIAGLTMGLKDSSVGVRLSALKASVNLLTNLETSRLGQYEALIGPMLEILPPMASNREEGRLASSLLHLIDLASTPKIPSRLLKPHLSSLLSFSLALMAPSASSSTPFPNKSHQSPPFGTGEAFDHTVRQPALELLLSIAETAPSMTRNFKDFAAKLVPALLGMMGELQDDGSSEGTGEWLNKERFDDDDEGDEGMAIAAEGGLDRLAQALGGATVFPYFVQNVGHLFNDGRWQYKSAALSAIASLAEGCTEEMSAQLAWTINIVLPMMKDPHPRIRYAAIYAIGQMSTDLEGTLQEEYGAQVLQAIVEVTNSPEPRIQAYGAAGLVNFFAGAEDITSVNSVLPEVFQQMVKLLHHGTNFVKENAIQAVSLLASCMETDFDPLYASIMPDLLNLLEAQPDPSIKKMRNYAMDCAAKIARATDSSIFAPDASRLLNALRGIQLQLNTETEEDEDAQRMLLCTFAALADIVGVDAFRPYIEDAFPRLVAAARKDPNVTISALEDESLDDDDDDEEEWEKLEMDGDVVAVRSSEMDSKCEAIESLVIMVQAISSALPLEALQGILEFGIPLLKYYFSVAVREASAALIAVTVQGLGKMNLSPEQRQVIISAVSDGFSECIASDTDPELITTFISSWTACWTAMPGCLSALSLERFVKAIEARLTHLQSNEQGRQPEAEDEDDWADVEDDAAEESVFESINDALKTALGSIGASFPIQPILPFLALMNGANAASTQFALRLMCDLITTLGDVSEPAVRGYLDRVHNALTDQDPTTRRAAAYCVGVSAEHVAFTTFVTASIEPLFNLIGPVDESDPIIMSVRDNAISSLGKIIRHHGERGVVNVEALLPRWVAALPVVIDSDEMTPSYTLFLELIARGHSSVSPSTSAMHVTKVLVSALDNEVLPPALHRPVAEALRAYLQSVPAGTATAPISPHLEAKVAALLEWSFACVSFFFLHPSTMSSLAKRYLIPGLNRFPP